ncbi:GDP-mannose 4,6-dehydratase [Collimonas silvisoli]|uniref:GDP-mannose 4,6-dehydratase n=1 Tax=Collimonas silvisoli TaxID=2825884 RepID=UPI001B8CC8C4|nr:GDP-mannose 4,6-dehydratase [Collimonas silvisoli]
MRILLTGADGFTGRHFADSAKAAGHALIAVNSDLKDREGLKQEILKAEPDAVVHLAAISFVGHADVSAFYDVNVIGTLNLLDGLTALPQIPRKILLASSANVYGNCEQSPISEEQAPAPVNHYAMSKLAMEYMARNYLDRLPLFFVRPFNYTGLGQTESFLIPKLVAHFARQAAFVELGNLDVEREFNDARFVCDAYLKLLEKGVSGEIYNVCSGKPVTLKSVIELLRKISGHELEVKVNPDFVRANEVHRLCGVPTKLEKCIGALSHPSLEDTLQWMLRNQI